MSRDGVSYIVHIARMKGNPHEVETSIANIAAQDSRGIRIMLQQEPGSGSALWIDSMRRGVLLGYPVQADAVRGGKFERSQPFRAAAEAGHVKLLRGAWNDDFLDECEQFSPDEREYAHDDQIDAACGAFNLITAPQPFEFIPVRRHDSLFAPSINRLYARGENLAAAEDAAAAAENRRRLRWRRRDGW